MDGCDRIGGRREGLRMRSGGAMRLSAGRRIAEQINSPQLIVRLRVKKFSPLFSYQKIYRGANSGSTWGWLILEGVKNPEIDLLV